MRVLIGSSSESLASASSPSPPENSSSSPPSALSSSSSSACLYYGKDARLIVQRKPRSADLNLHPSLGRDASTLGSDLGTCHAIQDLEGLEPVCNAFGSDYSCSSLGNQRQPNTFPSVSLLSGKAAGSTQTPKGPPSSLPEGASRQSRLLRVKYCLHSSTVTIRYSNKILFLSI